MMRLLKNGFEVDNALRTLAILHKKSSTGRPEKEN
tara:strand:+ start:651 stop:755 length:105 start_codon:yes stop_codon:yes gene_type:complete